MKVYLYDVFHRCDSVVDWTPFDCSIEIDTTEKVEGIGSIKMTSDDVANSYMRYNRTVDWSEFKTITFSVYHPGYTNEIGEIGLYTDAGNYKVWNFDFAAEWTEITIDLTSTPDSSLGTLDLSNINYIFVSEVEFETPGEDYYFDFFRGKSIDVTSDIIYMKITEELGMPSIAELKIKGESLDRFNAGLELEIYDADDVLSWTGRILYPESVLEGTKVVGTLKAVGSNSQFNNIYRKNYTTARASDYVLKDVIDSALPKFTYDDEIDDFSALTFKYDMKTKVQKLSNYLAMLERAVIHYKPGEEMFFNKYNNLTASGKSWNQNTTKVKIVNYTPAANRYITRTPVIGANNDLGQVYYVGKASDSAVQKYGINQLQPWRDSEITNYTEAKQLGDNLLAIYSMDTQMISLLTVGKKHVQVGYTIEFAWTGVFSITQADFLVTKRVWYPMNDICEIELTDNILTRKAFNIRVINKFYDEDAQQSYDKPDVPESTMDGVVQPLVSIQELRVAGIGGAHTLASHTSKTHQELTDYNAEADVKHLTNAQVAALHAVLTNLTQLGTRNHNDLQNISADDIKHITAAQLGALHAIVVAGDLDHNDLANLNAGDVYEHISQAQKNALHAIVVAGDLLHNSLDGLNAGDVYEHLSAAQVAALHAQLTNLTELGTRNHNDLQNIDVGDINHLTDVQVAALHAVAHVLATTGPHTGTLPWTDLNKAGSTINDIVDVVIIAQADNEVLAWDVGAEKWINQTPAEAGLATSGQLHTRLHAITDVLDHSASNWKLFYSDGAGHVIELALGADGEVLTSTGAASAPAFEAAGGAGASEAYVNAATMIGSANSEYVVCTYNEHTKTTKAVRYWGQGLSNVDGSNPQIYFVLPLSTNRGGKKLYIDGMKLAIPDADANNYVMQTDLYGYTYAGGRVTIDANPTDYTVPQEVEDGYGTVYDVSGYDYVGVAVSMFVDTASACEIGNPLLDCYYDD